jgi:DMSO reductase family type II enzyme heme b subunit
MKSRLAPLMICLMIAGCARAPKQEPEVIAVSVPELPANPGDSAWDRTPEHTAKMLLQDLVEPRLLEPSTAELRVRALTDGSSIAFRLEWADSDKNDTPGPAKMIDACAIQIPEKLSPEPPAPQMGEDGQSVQVTYWRADWQASVDGRGDSIRDLYPGAAIDHYPFEAQSLEKDSGAQQEMAQRYSPARALQNIRSGPRATPVEDLIATGPGTLKPGPSLGAKGRGLHNKDGWSVVISRKLPDGVAPGERTQIAFAVWQGSHSESGGRKMRTGWVSLLMRGKQ